jgi:hypothetical protein
MKRIDYHTKRELAIFTVVFLKLEFVFGMAYLLPAYFCNNCDSELMKEIGFGILIVAPIANIAYVIIRIIIELIRNRNKK